MKSPFLKNPKIVSIATGLAVVASLAAGPALAQAAPLSGAQISAVINLLAAFGAGPSVIANVQNALEGNPSSSGSTSTSTPTSTATSTPSSSSGSSSSSLGSCATLSGNLSEGDQGQNVAMLQQFLSKNHSIYPQGIVSGYFGHLTEDAIKHYQEAHGIVATGTPQTTGFGLLGPKTRGEINKEMERECEQGDSSQSSSGDHSASSTVSSDNASNSGDTSSASSTSSDSSSNSGDNSGSSSSSSDN